MIAQPSGDARIDAEAPAVIRSITWRAPDGPDCEALLKSGTAPVGGA